MLCFKKSNKIVLVIIFIVAIVWVLPFFIGVGLLFYSQHQNGIRCQWIDEQQSMNSTWIEEGGMYLLSFVQEPEFCELMNKNDGNTIKCEFFTSEVYFYKSGEETDEPMIISNWLYDKKTKALLVEVITVEEDYFGLQETMSLTFKKYTH